jgi:hypothetical protein
MDGPHHYQEAEQLLQAVSRTSRSADQAEAALLIAQAQVHALLALAAATATGTGTYAREAWNAAAGTMLPPGTWPPGTGPPGSYPSAADLARDREDAERKRMRELDLPGLDIEIP